MTVTLSTLPTRPIKPTDLSYMFGLGTREFQNARQVYAKEYRQYQNKLRYYREQMRNYRLQVSGEVNVSASGAARKRKHDEMLRDMVQFGAKVVISRRSVRNKKSGEVWKVIASWPDWGYFELERTRPCPQGTIRKYVKTILVSTKTLGANYVEVSAKAA